MEDSNLYVPLTEFGYDLDGDGIVDPLSGLAIGKVKALAPGKGKGRQDNPFSSSGLPVGIYSLEVKLSKQYIDSACYYNQGN